MFILCDDPQFVATLTRAAPGLWQFGHMSGPNNEMLGKAETEVFHRGLNESGVWLLKEPVSWSLNWMLHPGRSGRRHALPALIDAADGAEDQDLAA